TVVSILKNFALSPTRRTKKEIRRIRDSSRWRNHVRPAQLLAVPYCQRCDEKGILTLATEVDHIAPLEIGGEPFDPANLQSLCFRCHVIKTSEDNRRIRSVK